MHLRVRCWIVERPNGPVQQLVGQPLLERVQLPNAHTVTASLEWCRQPYIDNTNRQVC